ncbi:3-demethylubiquinone-9 3-methyltransferase [Corynebacterium occultum]|uniref:3-demethylubiquinone-9 3-methyltransferase n=1 Tax=Corynebacterium occultum TaxID=2675219 RepID=A0A6B8WA05_9CORY|nr:VOC family protein [Corynebacterium occultum]QGU07676.1 3-demethylubiquinone-9 3-methyltransferase [Corynebacterium occultum]
MQRIIPNIWINRVADEAAEFYVNTLPGTRLLSSDKYPEEGLLDFQVEFAGKTLVNTLEIEGFQFVLINAGDEFTPNPAISFFLNFDPSQRSAARAELDQIWEKLKEDGTVLMELGEYPFSTHYGWVQDRYGVNWQLMLTDPAGEHRPFLIPSLMFCGAAQNQAAEATDHYLNLLPDSRLGTRVTYPEAQGPATTRAIMFSDFQLYGQWLAAMDSAVEQPFTFSAGVSLQINATDQAEIDRFWEGLSHVPEAEQCGWCQDRWGVSWQIVPENLGELMAKPGGYEVMLNQHKIIIDEY